MKKFFNRFVAGTLCGFLFSSLALARELVGPHTYMTSSLPWLILFGSLSLGLLVAFFGGEEVGVE